MNISTDAYGKGNTIDSIHAEMVQLQEKYSQYIEQENLVIEVETLKKCLEETLKGSPEAADYLRESGHEVLNSIKTKLNAALTEQERIVEESPTADDVTGKKTHEISCASALVVDAEDKLDPALNEILS